MTKSRYECAYCGHRFSDYSKDMKSYLYEEEWTTVRCPKCNDRNVKELKDEKHDVFGYDYDPNERMRKRDRH